MAIDLARGDFDQGQGRGVAAASAPITSGMSKIVYSPSSLDSRPPFSATSAPNSQCAAFELPGMPMPHCVTLPDASRIVSARAC